MKSLSILTLTLATMLGAQARADKYTIDPSHTSFVFKIAHLGFSHVYGMFGDVTGSFELDEAKPANNKLDLSITVDSIDTKAPKRDEHLKKPDFFDSKQFSKITFKSDSIKKVSGNKYAVRGELTLHGMTKPLSFELTRGRTGEDPMKNIRTGGDTKFSIKRSDFGMNFMQGPNMVGDEVEVMASFEGIKQK